MHILLTAGGTREPIDGVRHITNMSRGTLPAQLADLFLGDERVDKITFVHTALSALPQSDPRIKLVRADSVEEVLQALQKETLDHKPDVILHAMAVSDYKVSGVGVDIHNLTPPGEGAKMSSAPQKIYLELSRAPKIIDHLREWGPHTLLVGFKLTQAASDDEMENKARLLLERAHLDMVLANDLDRIKTGDNGGLLVTKDSKQKLSARHDVVDVVLNKLSDPVSGSL